MYNLGIDLLERLLQMNPRSRLTAEQALSHPYFSRLHDPNDELSAGCHFDDSFENARTIVDLKQLIFSELEHVRANGPSLNTGAEFLPQTSSGSGSDPMDVR